MTAWVGYEGLVHGGHGERVHGWHFGMERVLGSGVGRVHRGRFGKVHGRHFGGGGAWAAF